MVIGDHGESLGEHGESGHGFFIYEGSTRVPFIIRAPYDSMRGRRVETAVRVVDLGPTALDLLGIGDGGGLSGRAAVGASAGTSLVGLLTGDVVSMRLPSYSEAIYPRYHFGWSDLAALRVGDMKYIAAPRPELYDLSTDPDERVDLVGERGEVAARMRQQLADLESSWRSAASTAAGSTSAWEVDPDTRARLAALGYVSTFVGSGTEAVDRSALADPKEKIHLYNLMRKAREASLREDGAAEAIEALRQVLDEDASVIDAWVRLGNEQLGLRDFDEAIASYKSALRLKPDYELAVINLATAYRRTGAIEEAIVGYRQFLRLDPRNAQIHFEVARMLTEREEFEAADEHLLDALRAEPGMAAAQVARGLIALRRSDQVAAAELIRAALVIKPDVRKAHFNLALLAEGRGDGREAVRLYQRELELYPQSFKAEFNLGQLLGALGDRGGEAAAYERAIEINPEFVEGHFFLAKTFLDSNRRLDRAMALARRGLELSPSPDLAPMGHFLLADIYSRLGRLPEARSELATARALQGTG
jgi:tetratricopeptide (TPR) repeat protein